MRANSERITYAIRRHRPAEFEVNEFSAIAQFNSNYAAQSAYFDVIQYEGVDAICVDGRLRVFFDED